MQIFFLTAFLVLIYLSDSYLRYLSFCEEMTDVERQTLRRRFLIYGIFCAAVYGLAFARFGISSPLYKTFLMAGDIPWLLIFMVTVRRETLQHVFVFGMSKVWSVIQHNWAASSTIILFENRDQEFLLIHSSIYLILFLLLLPVERRFFLKLLPPLSFFESYGKFIAIFPLIIISGSLILWAQEPMVHSWAERFSRLYIPFVFFFFYRHVVESSKQLYERRQTVQNLRRMEEHVTALSEYNRLIEESHEKIAVMRHDLRHSYRLIYMMLEAGKLDEARRYIQRQEKLLGETAVKSFCAQPLINVALLVYVRRAESLGIRVRHKINLPEELGVDESDLALLISNLLENAINASICQAPDRREISINIQNVDGQFVLEISNLFDGVVSFDENNMPRTSREGHGLGMVSVKNFAERYKAYIDFSQIKNNRGGAAVFKATLYWRNQPQFLK